jgi:integrase
MNAEDRYFQDRRWWVRLHEKGDKRYEMPAHHKLQEYMAAYIEAVGIAGDKGTPLFRTARGKTQQLTERRISQPEVYLMIRRRAAGAGIQTLIGCHTFRSTGITAYLKIGGKLEVAQQTAERESARTTGLYDRHGDEASLEEVERIMI